MRRKPHIPHLALAVFYASIWIVFGLVYADYAVGIDLHDTYYVVGISHLCLFFVLYELIPTITYYVLYHLGKKTNRTLTMLHLLVSTALPILLIMLYTAIPGSDRYYGDPDVTFFLLNNLLAIVIVAGPVLLIVNILIAVLNKK